MKHSVVWLAEAGAELKSALARYESIRPELGVRFAEAIIDTVEAIAKAPLRFAVIGDNKRRAGVRRFSYGIIFLMEDSQILVVACFHGRRHPKHWETR